MTEPAQRLATTTLPGQIAPEGASASAAGPTAGGASRATPSTVDEHSAVSLNGPTEAKVGEEFQVSVLLSSGEGITHLRSQLRFDSTALQLVSADPGDMVPSAAGSPSVSVKGGGAQLDIVTTPDAPMQGNGSLMVLRFKALAARSTNIAAMLNVLGGTGAAVGSSTAAPLQVAIRQ
jgi:hypothetical protein